MGKGELKGVGWACSGSLKSSGFLSLHPVDLTQ